jgi:sugar O-acyltransferase (sialic acid O-acetyltransferase NeuD family)
MTRVGHMELFIIGGGGHGSEVADLALRCGITPAGIADDRKVRDDRFAARGIPLVGTIMDVPSDARFTFGVGMSDVRQKLAPRVPCAPAAPLVDPSAVVSPTAVLGLGTQVFWHASVSPLCTLGEHVLVGHGAAIGHDSVLEDLVCVLPGARIGGDVVIGEGTSIGSGALVLRGVRIGAHAHIGAGAVVTRPVEPGGAVVGPLQLAP